MIVLDLEWNQPFGGRRMEEIIQIGAVRLAEPGGAVRATGLPGTALAGIPIHVEPSPVTTTFTNVYGPSGRTQYITAVAAPVIEENSLSFSASPAISVVFRPWSRIWRRIRPDS